MIKLIDLLKEDAFLDKWNEIDKIVTKDHSDETRKKKSEAFKKRNIDWTYRNQMVSQKRRKPILQYDLEDNFIREWDSVQEFENTTGLKSNGSICLCCQGKRQSTLGYKWKYKNN